MNVTLHLIRIRPEKNQWRYYRLDIWPDLFGGASLIREWGRIGQDGHRRCTAYASEAEAAAALRKIAQAKTRRGYRMARSGSGEP